MNLNNSFCFYVLCFIHLNAHAQFEFDGQILAQTNIYTFSFFKKEILYLVEQIINNKNIAFNPSVGFFCV